MERPKTPTPRQGSAMSSMQLAWTVVDGRKVTFHFLSGHSIEGYICGMDDFHWMVITPDATKHLIHKGSVSIIDLSDASTYGAESRLDELEKVVHPFLLWCEERYLGRREKERVSA